MSIKVGRKIREIVKIAGRGERGSVNWGVKFDSDRARLEPWLAELNKHIGEVVMMTGGGCMNGEYWLGVLESAQIDPFPNGDVALHVKLTHVTPDFDFHRDGKREIDGLTVDSWQISIFKEG